MSNITIHPLDTAWTASGPALVVTADGQAFIAGQGSNRLESTGPGAANTFAEVVRPAPLDLGAFDEVRFWVRADRPADGSAGAPFYLELSYLDDGDVPTDEHRWLVPVGRPGVWEQRRIGIEGERRSAVRRVRFRCLTDVPFVCHVGELLAVCEEPFADLEEALADRLGSGVDFPGLSGVPLAATAPALATQIVVPKSSGFAPGNRVRVTGGSAGEEAHVIAQVLPDQPPGSTTLVLVPGDVTAGTLPAGAARVGLTAPVFFTVPPVPPPAVSPALVASVVEVREDWGRSPDYTQRDSFRVRGNRVVCSVRPSARAYQVDYQIAVVAPDPAKDALLRAHVLRRLSMDHGLRISGSVSPLAYIPAPVLQHRRIETLTPLYVRIGIRMEVAPRVEQPWVRHVAVVGGPIDAPADREGVVIDL